MSELDLILAAAYGTARQAELRGESSAEAYRARLQLHLDRLLGASPRARPIRWVQPSSLSFACDGTPSGVQPRSL